MLKVITIRSRKTITIKYHKMKTEELLELYSIIEYGNWIIQLVENDL
jgi:hypothetical protein